MPGSLRLRDRHGSSGDVLAERYREELEPVGREERVSRARWSINLRLRGIALLWAAWGGTMVIAFLLGTSLGRHQGVRSALEELGQESVRVPLPASLSPKPVQPAEAAVSEPPPAELPRYTETEKAIAKPEALQMSAAPPAARSPAAGAVKPAPAAGESNAAPAAAKAEPFPPSTRWIVQAAAFRNRAQAQSAAKNFRKLGLAVLVDTKDREGSKYYRVLLGPYASPEKAAQAKNQAVRAKVVKGELYIKQLPSQ